MRIKQQVKSGTLGEDSGNKLIWYLVVRIRQKIESGRFGQRLKIFFFCCEGQKKCTIFILKVKYLLCAISGLLMKERFETNQDRLMY